MGPLIALIGQFVALIIVSSIIAGITASIIAIFSKKEKRRKRVIIGIFTTFYILFSFALISFIGLIIISQTKNVDIGFGDSWKVPINDTCEMIMINIPDNAFIQCDGNRIDDIIKIEKDKEIIYGLTSDKRYFAFDLETMKTNHYKSENDLLDNEKIDKLNLLDVNEFYHDKRWEICKFGYLIILVAALLIIGSTYPIIYRIVIRSIKDKQLTTQS